MTSSEVVEESDYLLNDAPLCNQEEPEKVPKMHMKASEVREEGELQAQRRSAGTCRKLPRRRDEISAGLEESEIQSSEESINIEPFIPDEMDTETPPETADIEAHDSEAPVEKTDAEAISRRKAP
jgi:hypothetical protein